MSGDRLNNKIAASGFFRKPGRLRCGMLGVWVFLTPILAALYVTVPASPDLALFDYIAWMHIKGAPYYAGVAEQNWPGAMLIHELGIRLFGVHSWTFRATDFILLQMISIGGAAFLSRSGFRLAPVLLLIVYPVLYITAGLWMSGQRDIVAAGFLVIAAGFILGRSRGKLLGIVEYLLAGGLLALAVLTRPTYLSFYAGLIVIEIIQLAGDRVPGRSAIARVGLLVIGFLTPMVVMTFTAYSIGSLDDWYQQSILFNLQAYPSPESRLRLVPLAIELVLVQWRWISVLAFAGFVLWVRRERLTRGQLLLGGITAAILLSYAAQNKGFGYHLGGLLLVLAMLLTIGLDEMVRLYTASIGQSRRLALLIGLLCAAGLTAAVLAKKMSLLTPNAVAIADGDFSPVRRDSKGLSWNEIERIVSLIREGSTADDYYLQWGRNFEVGFLAERRSSIRFVSSPALYLLSDRFEGTEEWLREIRENLDRKPPKFVLIERGVLDGESPPYRAAESTCVALQLVLKSIESYDVAIETDSAVLFRARGAVIGEEIK